MADTPTPRSYRFASDIERSKASDPIREGLHDITTLLIELRTQVKNLRHEVEELKLADDAKCRKTSWVPTSLRRQLTPKNITLAAVIAVLVELSGLLDRLQKLYESTGK